MITGLLLATGLPVLLYSSGFLSLFTPLPLAIFCHRQGSRWGGVALFSALLLVVSFYQILGGALEGRTTPPAWSLPLMNLTPIFSYRQVSFLGLLEFSSYGVIGMMLPLALRTVRVEWGIVKIFLGLVVLLGGGFLLFHLFFDVSLVAKIRETIEVTLAEWARAVESDGVVAALKDPLFFLIPSLFFGGTLITISLNLLILRRWVLFRDKRIVGDYSRWSLPEGWIWFPIAVGGIYFLNHYLGKNLWIEWGGLNLLLTLVVIYFFQGVSILSFFWQRPFPPVLRLLAYFVFIVLFQLVAVVITLTGLFDFWFDFRKLKKR